MQVFSEDMDLNSKADWTAAKITKVEGDLSNRVSAMAAHYITVAGGFSLRFSKQERTWTG